MKKALGLEQTRRSPEQTLEAQVKGPNPSVLRLSAARNGLSSCR